MHKTYNTISPLVPATFAITLGVFMQYTFLLSTKTISALFFLSFFLFGYKKTIKKLSWNSNIFFLCSLFCTSLMITKLQQIHHDAVHTQITSGRCDIRATVKDIQTHNHTRLDQYILLQITEYKYPYKKWTPLESNGVIYTKKIEDLHVGDYIELQGIKSNRAQNSFKSYLIYQSIGAYFFCPYLRYTIINRPRFSINRWLHTTTKKISNVLEKKLSPETFCLFSTLFLGKKMKHIDPSTDLPNKFRQWGVSHLLARSGAHLAIFLYLYYTIFQFFPLPLAIKQLLCILLCIIYFLLSFSSTSFLRALTTILLLFSCAIAKRPTQLLHTTLVVYNLFLLCNPISLFFLDFQLSFLFTISLSWLARKIYTTN